MIFDEFYESESILNHSSGSGNLSFLSCGLGLGLATVKSVLEAHKSSFEGESEVGKGSRFYFTFPEITAEDLLTSKMPEVPLEQGH